MKFYTRKMVAAKDLNSNGSLFGGRLLAWIDEEAFIVEFDVNTVKGGVLRRYLNKKGEKKLAKIIAEEHSETHG